ncbi:MAG TPA: helix-hairpin-helix domain-containing protein [Fulvivirga sp.]|nr:helix-hairpin-helix domain-containing protein [Fulvivirga sp.]
MKAFWLYIALLLVFSKSLAQDYPQQDIDIEQFIENVFAVQNGDVSSEDLYESLLLFYSNPINLNNTDIDELRSLFILSESQLKNFFDYKNKYGDLLSIYELQNIPEFDLYTIYQLMPFVIVRDQGLNSDNRPILSRILNEKNNYLLLRYERTLEDKKGYLTDENSNTSRYLGSPNKIYSRFRISHIRDFSIGFTAEKDAGEELIWDKKTNRYGADFYSGHIQLQNQGRLKNIIVGDYQIQYGQSMLLGAGFNVGKGAETITTVRRSNLGIRPYTSVIETNFFRGVAATVELTKKIDITGFYSRLKQDASVRNDTLELERQEYISSLLSSGFHRTPNELASKNTILEQNYGATLLYHNKVNGLSLGSTFILTELSSPLIRADKLYNKYEFKGTENYNIGIFGDYNWQNFSFFGEGARSKSGGLGGLFGVITSLTPKLETSIVLRNYDKDFHSTYGNAFGESIRNINEHGVYWGLKYSPSRRYEFTAYFDSFSYPWIRSTINAPSSGYEYLFRANYKPNRSTLFYVQFRQQSKADNASAGEQTTAIRYPMEGIKRNYAINLDFPANDMLSFKSRIQWSTYDFNNIGTKGYAAWQDLNIDLGKVRISGRFAIFDTENFNNAQYAYERDLLYAFSIPAYSGQGTRQYILVQYKALKKITFWVKYARTHYRDRETVGTGLEEINGNVRTDLKLQARITF